MKKEKCKKRDEIILLLKIADGFIGEALRKNGGKNHNALAAEDMVDAQCKIMDAVTHLEN